MSSVVKSIVLTQHADERMTARNIHLNQLTPVIRAPARNLPGNTPQTRRLEGDVAECGTLVAIVEENSHCIRVITAYWKVNT